MALVKVLTITGLQIRFVMILTTGANRTPLAWVTVVFVRDSQIRISVRPSVQFHRDKTKNFPHLIRTSPIKSSVKPRQWTSSSNSSLKPRQWLFLSMRFFGEWDTYAYVWSISFPVVVRIDDGTQWTLLIEFRYSKQLSRQRNVRLLQLFSEVKFLLSQTHLTDFIDNSCKKGLCWSIHNDDPFFSLEAIAQVVDCPFAPTFLSSEVFLWARHISLN